MGLGMTVYRLTAPYRFTLLASHFWYYAAQLASTGEWGRVCAG